MMKFSLKLFSILFALLVSITSAAQETCADRGCYCGEAERGNIIPIACYSDYQKCCSGEAPEHIKKHFVLLKGIGHNDENSTYKKMKLSVEEKCFKYDGNSDLVYCKDGVYEKVHRDDPNALPRRIIKNIIDSSAYKGIRKNNLVPKVKTTKDNNSSQVSSER